MNQSGLPDDVERFISAGIDSVAQLEILLLLQETPGREWTAAEISSHLRISDQQAATHLDGFLENQLVASSGAPPRFRYAPPTPTIGKIVASLAGAYRERRVAVITQIFSRPSRNLQTFADAFKLGKSK